MSDSFCPLPWIQISIKPSGMMTTCCVMRALTKEGTTPSRDIQKQMECGDLAYSRLWWENNKNTYICGTDSMFDVLNAQLLKDVRVSMLKGERHDVCKTCWTRERYSNGKVSVRVRVKRKWDKRINPEIAREITGGDGTITKFDIKNIELRFGNHCNLKCVMCHPGHSNLWYSDWKKLSMMKTFWTDDGSDVDSFLFGGTYYSMEDSTPFDWYKTNLFKKEFLEIHKGLEEIYWAGGEPLLCKEHFDILQILIESGVSKNINLRYDSNITYIPDRLIEMWKKFRWVGVQASVDDVGIKNDYIRYPSKWNIIIKNLKKLDNLGREVAHSGTTISCYNILTFLDFAEWAKENMSRHFWEVMHFKHVIAPFHLCPSALPKSVKQRAIDIICDYLNSFDSSDKSTMHYVKVDMFKNYLIEELDNFNDEIYQGFLQHTKNLDKIRDLQFKYCFPELYEMIKEDFDGVYQI